MKLKFFARDNLLVTVPGQSHAKGQHLRRVGRTWTNEAVPPATKEPFEVESDSDAGRRLAKLTSRDGSLWPADQETADAIGVPFVSIKFENNSWVQANAKPATEGSE